MSGHSKWSSIKHKKGAADAKRGKLFSKLARAIIVAARDGGGDIDGNPTLATAVQKARDASMPKENIQRAIDRGTGAGADAAAIEQVSLRGLRARRRGDPGRGADRQPQPHDRRRAARLHQARRQPRRARLGRLDLRETRRRHRRRRPLRRGRRDRRDRRRRRGRQRGRRPAAGALRAERPRRRARGARRRRRRDPVLRGDDGAEEHGRGRQGGRQGAAGPARRARGARRRQRGPRQLRHPRGDPRASSPPSEGIRGSAQNPFTCKS